MRESHHLHGFLNGADEIFLHVGVDYGLLDPGLNKTEWLLQRTTGNEKYPNPKVFQSHRQACHQLCPHHHRKRLVRLP